MKTGADMKDAVVFKRILLMLQLCGLQIMAGFWVPHKAEERSD